MYIGLFKTDIISVQSSDILSPGSSITGTTTYKITDSDINTGSVTNLASATGSFNNQPVISPQTVAIVFYKHPTNDRDNNSGPKNGGYSSEPSGAIETQNSESNGHKAKAHLSKHKHKNHSKHHKTGKKSFKTEKLK
jgi:hypothetical protein